MFELFKALLLGAVQGITEFLPVSSTGHLIIFEHLLGISQDTFGLAFDAALHMGTLVAVLWFFKSDWLALVKSFGHIIKSKRVQSSNEHLVLYIIFGTIPAVLLGLLFEDYIDSLFRSPVLVGMMLILFSGVLYYVEKIGKRNKEIKNLSTLDSILIGIAQSIALIPGVSRSGITMAAGMSRQLTRADAARFAFLLSAPIVAGAGGKKLIETMRLFTSGNLSTPQLMFFVVGMVSAAFFGHLTIKYFMRYLSKHSLLPFILYRVILGLIVIGVSIIPR